MIEHATSFARTFGLYALVIATAPLVLFAALEVWQALSWLFASSAPSADLIWALPYGLTVAGFAVANATGRWPFASVGFALGGLKAAGITAGIYGLFDWIRALLPSLGDYDVTAATLRGATLVLVMDLAFSYARYLRGHRN